jgi:tetratricopeptide (TPR) repeat protein
LGSLKALQIQYKGMRDFFQMNREGMRSARDSFELLHDLHPDAATGSTWTSLCHWFELQRGWSDNPEASSEAVKHWANIAMKLEDADGQAHTALCHVHLLKHEFDEALKIGDRAITLRPSCANANGFYAHSLYFCGLLDKAIHHARLAIRFSPAYPPLFAAVLAGALHARGDQETAIAIAKDSLRLNQQDGHARTILCSALMDSSREQEARAVAVDLKRLEPDFQTIAFLERLPFRSEDMRKQLAGNFSKALEGAV